MVALNCVTVTSELYYVLDGIGRGGEAKEIYYCRKKKETHVSGEVFGFI